MQKSIVLISLLFCLMTTIYASPSPVGYWKTIDDVTGKPKAIVEIWQDKASLYGKITKLFHENDLQESTLCRSCPGNKRNQPLIGLVILEKLKKNQDNAALWTNGEILDPKTGKIYNSNVAITADGQKLNVRGYLGIPMFGRTQTWIRVENPKT